MKSTSAAICIAMLVMFGVGYLWTSNIKHSKNNGPVCSMKAIQASCLGCHSCPDVAYAHYDCQNMECK